MKINSVYSASLFVLKLKRRKYLLFSFVAYGQYNFFCHEKLPFCQKKSGEAMFALKKLDGHNPLHTAPRYSAPVGFPSLTIVV